MTTRERISSTEERLAKLRKQAKYEYAMGDTDAHIDTCLEIAELEEQLNFAWQDDEAEYDYAVQMQEFNPDGSLMYY